MKRVLAIGCHCDDIELGCGATLSKHFGLWDIRAVVMAGRGPNDMNLELVAMSALRSIGVDNHKVYDFPNLKMADHRQAIWETLHQEQKDFQPDVVLVNYGDEHQDHQAVFAEAVRCFRSRTLLAFEIGRSCPAFEPQVYEPVSLGNMQAKVRAVAMYQKFYPDRNYFRPEFVEAQLRSHGMYIESDFAEVFRVVRKIGVM